jgi:hypothetical protein
LESGLPFELLTDPEVFSHPKLLNHIWSGSTVKLGNGKEVTVPDFLSALFGPEARSIDFMRLPDEGRAKLIYELRSRLSLASKAGDARRVENLEEALRRLGPLPEESISPRRAPRRSFPTDGDPAPEARPEPE